MPIDLFIFVPSFFSLIPPSLSLLGDGDVSSVADAGTFRFSGMLLYLLFHLWECLVEWLFQLLYLVLH